MRGPLCAGLEGLGEVVMFCLSQVEHSAGTCRALSGPQRK